MNPNTDLMRRIEALEAQMRAMQSANTVPINVERALKARLGGLYSAQDGTGSYDTTGLERTISLSGSAEDIEVLEYPAGYILVRFEGQDYKVPFFND